MKGSSIYWAPSISQPQCKVLFFLSLILLYRDQWLLPTFREISRSPAPSDLVGFSTGDNFALRRHCKGCLETLFLSQLRVGVLLTSHSALTTIHNKELSNSVCPQCWGWGTLLYPMGRRTWDWAAVAGRRVFNHMACSLGFSSPGSFGISKPLEFSEWKAWSIWLVSQDGSGHPFGTLPAWQTRWISGEGSGVREAG